MTSAAAANVFGMLGGHLLGAVVCNDKAPTTTSHWHVEKCTVHSAYISPSPQLHHYFTQMAVLLPTFICCRRLGELHRPAAARCQFQQLHRPHPRLPTQHSAAAVHGSQCADWFCAGCIWSKAESVVLEPSQQPRAVWGAAERDALLQPSQHKHRCVIVAAGCRSRVYRMQAAAATKRETVLMHVMCVA